MSAIADSAVKTGRVAGKSNVLALVLCWLLLVFDGYDLIVYGTVQSTLLADPTFGLTKENAGTVGSMAFIGMMVGALFAGRLSDAFGRKRTMILVTIIFTLATLGCGLAPNATVFGAMRLLAGIGLGGLVPAVMALSAELVSNRWRAVVATAMMSGIPLGGSIAALIGIPILQNFDWRTMFYLPVIIGLLMIPAVLKWVPETLADKPATKAGDTEEAPKGGFGELLRQPYLLAALALVVGTAGTTFAWYGLGTWLPTLMEMKGYDLGSALTFSLALNLGAVAGSAITAWAGDRFTPMSAGAVAAALAAISLFVMMQGGVPVWVIYVLLIVAGVGTHGTQILLNATITKYFPAHLRGTAVGWSVGVGRIGAIMAPMVIGFLLSTSAGVDGAFIAFACGSVVSAALLFTLVFVMRPIRALARAAAGREELNV
ncbi:4-hydroxybenzoate transporter PcaK [Corynebacterium occultum]|uniref:4-hydroxybenzoate transporter PcaK n=1 Tax=Corynebacterium occultum TaxID=2675219 RepID=A0A6B8WEN7_9CORY|nr:MFS transporter [Corynebacterium occultum]QGU08450.1 4-hydroxybenzoate transporter PcaK [Corynebacterium occultum]